MNLRSIGLSGALFCLLAMAWPAQMLHAEERGPEQISTDQQPKRPFEAGVAAYDRGEFALAREIWLPWAHGGDPAAQRNMAHLYRMGLGVAQDFSRAAAWYRMAADAGLARAQANLAMMYLRGQGLEQSAQEAAYWFTAAALHGHALAQYNLALLYLRGEGVERNEAKAAGWLYLAARAGHQPAMRRLARLVTVISGPAGPPSPTPQQMQQATAAQKTDKTTVPAAPAKVVTAASPGGDTTKPTATVEAAKVESGENETNSDDVSLADAVVAFFSRKPDPGFLRDEDTVPDSVADETPQKDIAAGLVALHTANYSVAKARWLPLAKNGHAEAQYQLGKLYLQKGFDEASRPQSFYWLSRAAAQQHLGAKLSKSALDRSMSSEERSEAQELLESGDRGG